MNIGHLTALDIAHHLKNIIFQWMEGGAHGAAGAIVPRLASKLWEIVACAAQDSVTSRTQQMVAETAKESRKK